MVTPMRMGPGAAPATQQPTVPAPAAEPSPAAPAPELVSASQLTEAEQAQVRQQRAERILQRPGQLMDGLSPAEQLRECEAQIRNAEDVREGTIREARARAYARFVDAAGPYLEWIRDNELYRIDMPGRTFEAYLKEVWGYGSSQGYAFMDAVMVRAALGLAGTDEHAYMGQPLTSKHYRALAPAIRAASPEIGPRAWQATATANDGKVTESGLRESVRVLMAGPARSDDATHDESNDSFDSSARAEESNTPTNERRWAVNEGLQKAMAALQRAQDQVDSLVKAGVAPLDAEDAARSEKQIRALARWFVRSPLVPVDAIVDAELVD